MTTYLERKIEQLEIERDVLRDKLQAYEDLLNSNVPAFRTRLHLTKSQALLGSMLLHSRIMRRTAAMAALYGHRVSQPNDKLIDVWMSRIRKALKPMGVTIHTVTSEGWYINTADKEVLKRWLEK